MLVLETDDQTVESLRVMGNVQRLLAAEGTTFANSFVGNSLCCPSRATLLTGQYSHNNGVFSNRLPSGGYYKLDSANTLAVWLQRAGYQTAHLGKYLNGYGTRNPNEMLLEPLRMAWTVDPSTYRFYRTVQRQRGADDGAGPISQYLTDVVAARGGDGAAAGGRRPAVLHVDGVPGAAPGQATEPDDPG